MRMILVFTSRWIKASSGFLASDIVRSVSLMANADDFEDAVEIL